MSGSRPALKVFISYSHLDDEWRRRLDAHLGLLKRQGVLDVWHDRRLLAGEPWAEIINEHLKTADLVLLLVSSDFIGSDYCFGLEMTTALDQERAGRSRVIPIIVRRCDWETAPFGKLQALPRDNQPVATHPGGQDVAFTEVAKELRTIAGEISDRRSKVSPLPGVETQATSADIQGLGYREAAPSWLHRHRRVILCAAAAAIAVVLAGGAVAFNRSSSMVAQGDGELRIGAYDTAERQFRRAIAANPFEWRARRGLQLARLGLMIPDLEKKADDFGRELDELVRRTPDDPQVLLFSGDRSLDAYRRNQDQQWLEAAIDAYSKAVTRDPSFPEAHARLAYVHLLESDLPAAEQRLRTAIKVSGNAAARVPQYQHNLASVLAAQGKSGEALNLYEGNGELLLSAVEAAMLLWSTAEPDALARARSKLAGALDRQDLLRSGPNQYAWLLIADSQAVLFGLPEAKVCLTTLALAAADRLLGERASAEQNVRTAAEGRCKAVHADAALIVCARLDKAAHVEVQRHRVGEARSWLRCTSSRPENRA